MKKETPDHIKKLIENLVIVCPLRNQEDFSLEDLAVEIRATEGGWIFQCQVCIRGKCSGFIRNSEMKESQ